MAWYGFISVRKIDICVLHWGISYNQWWLWERADEEEERKGGEAEGEREGENDDDKAVLYFEDISRVVFTLFECFCTLMARIVLFLHICRKKLYSNMQRYG